MKRATAWKLPLMLILTLTTACTATGGDSCAGWKPLRLDGASINGLTDRDARAVLAHNQFWAARCGWR